MTSMKEKETLAFNLKRLRQFKGLTQEQLAKIEELYEVKLYSWEKRKHSNRYFGSDKNAYNKLYRKNAQWWFSNDYKIRKSVISIISQGIVQNLGQILDLGCGHARTLARLSHDLKNSKKINFIGLDFALEGLRLAECHKIEKNSSLHLICGDMTCTPFKDKTFGLVISNGSHEHLEKPNFKEVKRILKDKGVFVCLLPIVDDLEREIKWEICNVQRENKFKKQTWINILERDGFRAVLVDDIFICEQYN